jgi:hypothetical protein
MRGQSLEKRRAACWEFGVQFRERLVSEYMAANDLMERPLLKNVIDDLIRETLEAGLIKEVLPLDRFAQTEEVNGRIIVSINSRISAMPEVKDVDGVEYVAKWHEAVHVGRDFLPTGSMSPADEQLAFELFDVEQPRLIVCRKVPGPEWRLPMLEFMAENAGLAAAIAGPDLARCPAFDQFKRLAQGGGDLGRRGWALLYETASFVGINITALNRYLTQRGMFQIIDEGGSRRILAAPQLFGGPE